MNLFVKAITRFLLGIVLVGILVFLPAGTFLFYNGLVFMAVLFVPMFCAGVVMMIKSPKLLEKRLDANEKAKEQRAVIALSGLMFVMGFVVAGLSFRFGWPSFPDIAVIVATAVFLIGYVLFAIVLAENRYLSRTVKVQKNQKVIDTGLYSVVRHPMYSATVLMFLSMPVILGSVYSFFVFLIYPVLIGIRIKGEEQLLEKELDGYREYKNKVKYCLIPFVW